MSKASTIYDGIVAKMTAIFPAPHVRLVNPYDLTDNPHQYIKIGWGVRYNGATRIPYEICNRRQSQSFSLIFTREMLKIETRSDAFDGPTKALLEDAKLAGDAFYARDHIGISDIIKLDFASETGIQTVFGEKFNMLTLECTIVVDYYEPVT
jgi:hypothetical protein